MKFKKKEAISLKLIIPVVFVVLTVIRFIFGLGYDTNIHSTIVSTGIAFLLILLWLCYTDSDEDEADGHAKVGFLCCGTVCLVLQSLFTLLLWVFVLESDDSLDTSPIGKSSCTSTPGTSVIPYNPWGWWEDGKTHYLRCPYQNARWGDVNNSLPITVGPPYLYTQNKEDYPDRGRGIHGGWTVGVTTDRGLEVCPFVDKTAVNPFGLNGRGYPICAHCSAHIASIEPGYASEWIKAGLSTGFNTDDDCPGLSFDPYCVLCEYTWKQTINERYWTVWLSELSLGLHTVFVCSRCFIRVPKLGRYSQI